MWVEVHFEIGDCVVIYSEHSGDGHLNGRRGRIVGSGTALSGQIWFHVKLTDGDECFLYGEALRVEDGDALLEAATRAARASMYLSAR